MAPSLGIQMLAKEEAGMSGTRGGLGRIVAMGVAVALVLLLALAAEARAGKYAVAQCGWYVGKDADWADTTGGAKFRPDAYCVPPGGGDPFQGSHLKSFVREGQATVSGTRFARWRWTAPPLTGIVQVRGTWWRVLHDGFEQRLGTDPGNGSFVPFATATATDTGPKEFAVGFPLPQARFEDRLLCARAESKFCVLSPPSWTALRALTITVQDSAAPSAGIGGEVTAGGWRRGLQPAAIWAIDQGAGVRFAETTLDGARVDLTEYACATVANGGEWRATKMQPCALQASGTASIDTTRFADGTHALRHCVTDFAGNAGCTPVAQIGIDNNPPAAPRAAALEGGEGWRRANGFDLAWSLPDQGSGSPIWGAYYRLTGPAGYDSGVRFFGGRNVSVLKGLRVPAAGSHVLKLWLRDEAGNEAAANAVELPLRFDDQPPAIAFADGSDAALPTPLVATLADPLSGPAGGSILYRRAESERWQELPTKLVPGLQPGSAELRAQAPELGPGTYLFRAEGVDAAGNASVTGLRVDGTRMAFRQVAPAAVARQRTRLFAALQGGKGGSRARTVAFGRAAKLTGRLLRAADGAGIAGRDLRVVARPSRGGLTPVTVATVRTGARGGFELRLAPGVSRRISVNFAGDESLEPSTRRPLELRVRSGVSLRTDRTRLTTGQVLRMSGAVRTAGAALPRRGKLVAIEYLERATRRWRPVVITRSDHDGRYRTRYRFRYVSGAAEVRLRATALAEERWPYAPGSSAPVTVRVRGER